MMQIIGYKAFNSDKTNRYAQSFEINKKYQVCGKVKFGTNGNGYHFCKNICDVFRYFEKSLDINIALVIGSGNYEVFNDEYYGYYDMYVTQCLKIIKFLTREEIIEAVINSSERDIIKFITTAQMSTNEIKTFLDLYKCNKSVLKYILYYQLLQSDAFNIENNKILERVNKLWIK